MNIPLLLVIAVTVGAVVFGVMTLVTGGDPGLRPAEPDTRAHPLPGDRPLLEGDIAKATFDTALRGYRMDQVDQTLRRLAYDIGYKTELIQVLEAEIGALREGRFEDADVLAHARAASLNGSRGDERPDPEPEPLPIEFPEPMTVAEPDTFEEPFEEPLIEADEPAEYDELPIDVEESDESVDTQDLATPTRRTPTGRGNPRRTGVA